MADNDTTRNRYPKVCAGAETRTALARASNSYHRARSPPAACAPLSVPASAPALQTLPACPDAPHLMRHVLTALRSSLAHRVSRSIHNRPGPNDFSRRAAAGRCSSALSMRRSSRSQLEPRGEAWRAARVRPLAALRAAACADGRHGARLVLHAGRSVNLCVYSCTGVRGAATSGRLQSHTQGWDSCS